MDEEIKIVEKWNNVIRNEIKSSNVIIAILTEKALQSEEVKKEIKEAENSNIKIVPCFYKKILQNDIPYDLRSIQGIEFENSSELEKGFYKKIQVLDKNKITEILIDGETFDNKGWYEKAIECYNTILQIDPNNFSALFCKGNSLVKLGKYREAIDCYNEALRINPNNNITLKNKGYAYKRLGNKEQAEISYREAKNLKSKETGKKFSIFKNLIKKYYL